MDWDKTRIDFIPVHPFWGWLVDILHALKYGGGLGNEKEAMDSPRTLSGVSRPQTLTEMLDNQIAWYESKIADLKAAKAEISPEVERALNALSKL